MRKGHDGEKKWGKNGMEWKRMTCIVATNVNASRLPERRPTGTPTARANIFRTMTCVGAPYYREQISPKRAKSIPGCPVSPLRKTPGFRTPVQLGLSPGPILEVVRTKGDVLLLIKMFGCHLVSIKIIMCYFCTAQLCKYFSKQPIISNWSNDFDKFKQIQSTN